MFFFKKVDRHALFLKKASDLDCERFSFSFPCLRQHGNNGRDLFKGISFVIVRKLLLYYKHLLWEKLPLEVIMKRKRLAPFMQLTNCMQLAPAGSYVTYSPAFVDLIMKDRQ